MTKLAENYPQVTANIADDRVLGAVNYEIWKPVKGFEDYLNISNYGNVKILSRYVNRCKGEWLMPERMLIPKLTKKPKGKDYQYSVVTFSLNGKSNTLMISRAVYEAFNNISLGLKQTVIQKDGNLLNNKLDNIKIITRRDIIQKTFNKTGFRGVFKNIDKEYYSAVITFEGKRITVHSSENKEECHKIYQLATDMINQYDKNKIEILNKSKLKNKIIIAKVKSGV
jgi:hypothetical protein